jgi:CoA-binding protein/sugar transferase
MSAMKPNVADGMTPATASAAREQKRLPLQPRSPAVAATPEYPLAARITRVAVLSAADLSALILAGLAAYLTWALPVKAQSIRTYVGLLPLLSLFIAGYAQAGLYPGFGLGPVETLRRLSYVTLFGFLVLAVFPFALKLPPMYYSRVTFSFALVLSLVMLPVGRMVVGRIARRWPWWSEPVVVIGTGERAARAIRALRAEDHLGYRPMAVLSHRAHAAGSDLEGVPIRGGLDEARALGGQGIRVALVETDQLPDLAIVDLLQQAFHHVVLLRGYDDLPVEGIQIRNLGGIVGIEYTNNLLAHGNRVAKRAMDVIVGSLALAAAAPVIGFAALLVKVVDGGSVFFTQRRSGLDGRPIAVPNRCRKGARRAPRGRSRAPG